MLSLSDVKAEDPEAVGKAEADLEDVEPLRMRRRKRRKRKIIEDLDEFVVGDDFEELEDLDNDVGEPRVSKKRKGRSKSGEDAQPESAVEKQGGNSIEKCLACTWLVKQLETPI